MELTNLEGQEITLKKGLEIQTNIQVISTDPKVIDSHDPIKFAEAVRSENVAHTRELKLVFKNARVFKSERDCFGDERQSDPEAVRYYERWRYLKKIGIPTVGSMRVVDGETVVMGDMTADGSEFFGKNKSLDLSDEVKVNTKRELTDLENNFLQIPTSDLMTEFTRIQSLARSNGVRLPIDDQVDIKVSKDGWSMVVMDLTMMIKDYGFSEEIMKQDRDSMEMDIEERKRRLLSIAI